MEPWIIGLILILSLLIVLGLGVPIAFTMGGISLVLGVLFWGGFSSLNAFHLGAFGKTTENILSALPLYILMAAILQHSDLVDDLYETVYRWFGRFRGGLAIGTTFISAVFAAMVGIATVATATLGIT